MAIGIEYQRRILRPADRCGRRGAEASGSSREDNPVNLDARLARVAAGVHRLEGKLLVVLDVDRVLEIGARPRPHERCVMVMVVSQVVMRARPRKVRCQDEDLSGR